MKNKPAVSEERRLIPFIDFYILKYAHADQGREKMRVKRKVCCLSIDWRLKVSILDRKEEKNKEKQTPSKD